MKKKTSAAWKLKLNLFSWYLLSVFSLFLLFFLLISKTNSFHFHICSYNGYLPQGDRGRRRSKFVLYKRNEPSGVKRSKHYIVQSPQTSKAILDANQHSISYTLSRNQAVIVEYKEDSETDMFQVLNPPPSLFIHSLSFVSVCE